MKNHTILLNSHSHSWKEKKSQVNNKKLMLHNGWFYLKAHKLIIDGNKRWVRVKKVQQSIDRRRIKNKRQADVIGVVTKYYNNYQISFSSSSTELIKFKKPNLN